MEDDGFIAKIYKYINIIRYTFESNIALSGRIGKLPNLDIKMVIDNESNKKLAESLGANSIILITKVEFENEIREGILILLLTEDRLRILAIPFDPDRLTEVIKSNRGKDLLIKILEVSHALYDSDFGMIVYEDEEGPHYVLISQNDMLKSFITYDEFEEELYGTIYSVIILYHELEKAGYKPKLFQRNIKENIKAVEKIIKKINKESIEFYQRT